MMLLLPAVDGSDRAAAAITSWPLTRDGGRGSGVDIPSKAASPLFTSRRGDGVVSGRYHQRPPVDPRGEPVTKTRPGWPLYLGGHYKEAADGLGDLPLIPGAKVASVVNCNRGGGVGTVQQLWFLAW